MERNEFPILTPEDFLSLEGETFGPHGRSEMEFIKLAGHGAAKKISEVFPKSKDFLFLCGAGHNGADGWIAASHLAETKKNVMALEVGAPKDVETNSAKSIAVKSGVKVISHLPDFVTKHIIVDCIFGVGLGRTLSEDLVTLFTKINFLKAKNKIVAMDVPSGLNAKTGGHFGAVISADLTISMGFLKLGFFQNEGRAVCGKIVIVDLPYSKNLSNKNCHIYGIGPAWARDHFPQRNLVANKGDRGRVLCVAGAEKFPGAGILVTRAAIVAGAGYVHWLQDPLRPEWMKIPESIPESWENLEKKVAEQKWIWCIGPGLDGDEHGKDLLSMLLEKKARRVVVDAAAIGWVGELKKRVPDHWIMTPHPKELAGLLSCKTEDINRDRLQAMQMAREKFGGVFVLKGFKTLISNGTKTYLSLRGNSVLAKAGSGDVLSGIIAAYYGQLDDALKAASLGVVVHAMTGDHWLRTRSQNSFSPSEMLRSLPLVQKGLESFNRSL